MKGIASAEKMGLKPMRLRGGQVHLAYVVYKTARHPGSVLAPVAARLHPPPPCRWHASVHSPSHITRHNLKKIIPVVVCSAGIRTLRTAYCTI